MSVARPHFRRVNGCGVVLRGHDLPLLAAPRDPAQEDNNDFYPAISDWAGSGGKDGTYDVFTAATNKPLNKYIGKGYEVFRCPSDKGDKWAEDNLGRKTTNCFNQYGTSYLPEFAFDY